MDEDNVCYCCSQCGKDFSDAQKLLRHLKYHRNVNNRPCKSCNKTFPAPGSLQQHENKHRGEKPCKCAQCRKSFSFVLSAKRHAKAAHRGKKVFSSDQSGETIVKTSQPEDHKYSHAEDDPRYSDAEDESHAEEDDSNSHTKVKSHTCKHCGKGFKTFVNFKRHVETTHVGVKPLCCDLCGKTFGHPGNLTMHMFSHQRENPYRCKERGKTFTHCTHSEEKAHKCGQCGKAFKRESALRDHSLWHSEKVVIPCGECGIVFCSRQIYLSHRCLSETEETPHATNSCH